MTMPPRCSIGPALCTLCLLVAGCATTGGGKYPSLLPRAIESRSDAEPVVAAPAPVADPALDAKIAANALAVRDVVRAVGPVAQRAEAAARAASGAAAGSERWIAGQSALAELDDYRSRISALVTDLDDLAIARSADLLPEYPALTAARTTAQAELAVQTERIARLQAMMAAG